VSTTDDTETLAVTDRTTLRRRKDRGSHERALVNAILDEALVAHVAVAAEDGPLVLPMVFGRVGDRLYLHGALANHLLATATGRAPVCLTATLVDGLVLSRSAFHHSVNYRSVVVFGEAALVDDLDEKRVALTAVVDHAVAGRSSGTRPPTDSELRKTTVVHLDLAEGSAKVRVGGPVEDVDDLELDHWAGIVPVRVVFGQPEPDDEHPPPGPVPAHVLARASGA
jgi:uncharacterized protein